MESLLHATVDVALFICGKILEIHDIVHYNTFGTQILSFSPHMLLPVPHSQQRTWSMHELCMAKTLHY